MVIVTKDKRKYHQILSNPTSSSPLSSAFEVVTINSIERRFLEQIEVRVFDSLKKSINSILGMVV